MKTNFKQSRKVGVAGGFINQMQGNNSTKPVVGKGMTELMYSDRHAYEVLEVSEDGMSCVVDQYRKKRSDKNGMTESQEYIFDELYGNPKKLTWRNKKGGCWCWESKEIRVIPKIKKMLDEKTGEYFTGDAIKKVYGEKIYNEIYRVNAPEDQGTYELGLKHVEGITKEYTNYHKVSVIFGTKQEYYDFSF